MYGIGYMYILQCVLLHGKLKLKENCEGARKCALIRLSEKMVDIFCFALVFLEGFYGMLCGGQAAVN